MKNKKAATRATDNGQSLTTNKLPVMIHTKKAKKQITRCANCGDVIENDQPDMVDNLCDECLQIAEYHAASRSNIASLAMVYNEIHSRFGF